MQPDRFGQMSTHPPDASIWLLAAASIPLRDNPNRSRTAFGSAARSRWAAQYARHRATASRCNARRNRNTASHCATPADGPDHRRGQVPGGYRHRAVVGEVRGLGLAPPPRNTHHRIAAGYGRDVGPRGCHDPQATTPTDITALPRRHRNLAASYRSHPHQFRSLHAAISTSSGPRGRPRGLTLMVRLLPVLIDPRANLTTCAPGGAVQHRSIHPRPGAAPSGGCAGPSATARWG